MLTGSAASVKSGQSYSRATTCHQIHEGFSDSPTTQEFHCQPARLLLNSTELRKEQIWSGSDSAQFVPLFDKFAHKVCT